MPSGVVRESRIARADLFVVLSDVWFWRGGLTRNALHKATLISERLEKPVTILTTEFDADTDVSVSRMRATGLMGDRLVVRNLHQDAGVYGDTPTTFFASDNGRPTIHVVCAAPDLYPVDLRDGQTTQLTDAADRNVIETLDREGRLVCRASHDLAGRLRFTEVFEPETNRSVERRYLDAAGVCRLRYRRDPDNARRWVIEARDAAGATTRVFPGLASMRTAWLDSYAPLSEESVFQVEAENPNLIRAVLDMNAPGVAKVMMLHSSHLGYPHTYGSPITPGHVPVLKRLSRFDAFVLITSAQRDDIAAEFGPRTTLHSVPHDAPPSQPSISMETDTKLAVGIGRFAARKNWDHAIRAFAGVVQKVPDARFELWGMGPLCDEYEELIRELRLQDCVRIMGPTDDPTAVFRRAAFSVLANMSEGFGLVLLESLAAGTPVVVYDGKYGPKQMIRDGVDGVLVPVGDIDAFGNAMAELFTDPERQRRMGRSALEIDERFSAKRCVDGWLGVYAAALEQRDRRVTFPSLTCELSGMQVSKDECVLTGILDIGDLAEEPTVRVYIRKRNTIVDARYLEVAAAPSESGRLKFTARFNPGFIAEDGDVWDVYTSVALRNAHRFVRVRAHESLAVACRGPITLMATAKGNASLKRTPKPPSVAARMRRGLGRAARKIGNGAQRRVAKMVRPVSQSVSLVASETAVYLGSAPLRRRAAYARALANLPVDPSIVVVETMLDDAVRCNPRALVLRMLADPAYDRYSLRWVIRREETLRRLKREFSGTRLQFVQGDSVRHVRLLAQAGYVITNGSLPAFFQRREGQIVLNTWHGVPIKKMGFEIPNGRIHVRNVMRVLMQCDYLVSGSRYESETLYLRSHLLDGLYPGMIIETGHPRLDSTIHASREDQVERLRAAGVRIESGDRVVLYAPTWHGESVVDPLDTVAETAEFVASLRERLAETGHTLVLKFHPLTAKHLAADERFSGMLVPTDFDTNELLAAVDVLITDYSSVFVDFMVTKRPIVFYVRDVSAYISKRGVNLQPAQLPGPVVSDAESVARCVASAEEDRPYYAQRYNDLIEELLPLEDGHASERVLNAVFGDGPGSATRSGFDQGKTRVLIHAGKLSRGQKTRSALALLRYIDLARFDISVLAPHRDGDIGQLQSFEALPSRVRTFLRTGGNHTLRERIRIAAWQRDPERESKRSGHPVSLLARAWERLFGPCQFDIAVDLSGSSPLHTGMIACGTAARKVLVASPGAAAIWNGADRPPGYFSAIVRPVDAPYLRMVDPAVVAAEVASRDVRTIDAVRTLVIPAEKGSSPAAEQRIALPDSAAKTFVVASRDHASQLLVLHAFERMLEEHPHAHLLFIDHGKGARRVAKELAKTVIGERAAVINPRSALMLIAECGCLVALGDTEPSVTTLEATALGLATLVSDSTASREVFGGSGRLVAADEMSLANGMSAFLSGTLQQAPFDFDQYNREALQAFYRLCE